MGIANVNVAKMVLDDLNGLLGRPVELFVEDSAPDHSRAEVAAARIVERALEVIVGGTPGRRTRRCASLGFRPLRVTIGDASRPLLRAAAAPGRRVASDPTAPAVNRP